MSHVSVSTSLIRQVSSYISPAESERMAGSARVGVRGTGSRPPSPEARPNEHFCCSQLSLFCLVGKNADP